MDSELPPEPVVADKYRVTRLLGSGGMGSVWEGVHNTLGTRVAIKFIDREIAGSPDVRLRFINEAKATARLQSKHVVRVLDQGVSDAGWPYIVMEFLAGEPLDERLDRVRIISPEDTAVILTHVARALAKAHKVGIVHRDLKPENVFLVWDDDDQKDVCKVVDFGIAKFTDPESAPSSSTQTGAVIGTPHFMSPEQARGLRSVDPRSDLWSLGVIAYRCVTGRMPFEGEAVGDLLVKICTEDPIWPSTLNTSFPESVDDWFKRALAREPEARFQSAKELAHSFDQLVFSLPAAVRQRGDHTLSVPPPPSLESDTQATSRVAPTAIANTQVAAGFPTSAPGHQSKALWIAASLALLVAAGAAFFLARSPEGNVKAGNENAHNATSSGQDAEHRGNQGTPSKVTLTAEDAARVMGVEPATSGQPTPGSSDPKGPNVEPATGPEPSQPGGLDSNRAEAASTAPRDSAAPAAGRAIKSPGARPSKAPRTPKTSKPAAKPKSVPKVTEDELGY